VTDDLVLVDRPADGVAVLTLNRPAKLNALNKALLGRLVSTVDALAAEPGLRAVVLTGAGTAFCAGLDLTELGSTDPISPDSLDVLRAFPVPVLGAINGVAVTGGLELALACDFRIASETARFADTHSRVGVVPAWGLTARLPQAVGQGWARQMSFTGDFVDAATALRIGLVNQVVPASDLLATAVALAASIASTHEPTLRRVREIYDLVRDGAGADALAAERETAAGGRVAIADPAGLADRRAAVFERGRAQPR
jgi:enoyl-CoA hydratase/carnithine racemase